ncbi:unnamed protein product [Chrysodeixis includens]|uniref:Uncharacterized protein n=1 Tax=Chrysodeixis includens TaxID=689277 RepID=A0A9N8KZH3_CHRIL|nr:unnamed protein product [Chrysodeixis includens]
MEVALLGLFLILGVAQGGDLKPAIIEDLRSGLGEERRLWPFARRIKPQWYASGTNASGQHPVRSGPGTDLPGTASVVIPSHSGDPHHFFSFGKYLQSLKVILLPV